MPTYQIEYTVTTKEPGEFIIEAEDLEDADVRAKEYLDELLLGDEDKIDIDTVKEIVR